MRLKSVFPMLLLVLAAGGASCLSAADQEGLWLITPDEAATPAAVVDPDEIRTRGLFQRAAPLPDSGPDIQIEQPGLDQALRPPLDIAISFIPRRSPVDLSTLKVTLVKLVNIDLTDRLRQYVSAEGLRLTQVQLPSGEHVVRLSLSDQAGGKTVKEITLNVK